MAEKLKLEFWSDSFHEGNWACEGLSRFFTRVGLEYIDGFIPVYTFEFPGNLELIVTVFGSYKNWEHLPKKIEDLLDWGKPDLVIYNPESDKILLAVEETAATPTGNQALQRCERQFGSARLNIPFWYLIGEFAEHKDGGIRRDSIWPTILAIRLSNVYRTPSVTLHYSDKDNPGDYDTGTGVMTLFESISVFIKEHFGKATKNDLFELLLPQYEAMNAFVDSQWEAMINYMPLNNKLKDKKIAEELVKNSIGTGCLTPISKKFYCWPVVADLPKDYVKTIVPNGYINEEKIVLKLEKLVLLKKAYNLVTGAGSGQPQKLSKIKNWIIKQKTLSKKSKVFIGPLIFDKMKFLKTDNGNYHLTTAKNVFYLVNDSKEIETILTTSFKYKTRLHFEKKIPVFFYISNSITPGRIFGDPFTGQLSAYANIFTKNNAGEKERLSIAYYPYQVHNQLFDKNGKFNSNKGIIIMRDLLDYAIFHGGVIVNLKSGEIIC